MAVVERIAVASRWPVPTNDRSIALVRQPRRLRQRSKRLVIRRYFITP
jgi:hypothetical protein